MQDSAQANSALDAVRCLYLARVAEQKGHPNAARRWQQMAARRLNHLEPNTDRRGRCSPPSKDLRNRMLQVRVLSGVLNLSGST